MSDAALAAVILCGGRGTRLAGVMPGMPKPLAPVLGRPFLDYVLDYLHASSSVERVVLSTGYLGELIEAHYGGHYRGLPLCYSRESTPLGTGGAMLLAMRAQRLAAPFLLLNGDSLVDAYPGVLLALHRERGASITLALAKVDDASRYGTVALDGVGRVRAFVEKNGIHQPGEINAGVYLVEPAALAPWVSRVDALSLETDILPQLVAVGGVHALRGGRRFIDIGLPDTYATAADFVNTSVG